MSSRGFLGAGDLYIARYNPVTAAFDAFAGPYEATKFEIKPNVDLKDLQSRSRGGYGQLLETVPIPKPTEFTLEMPEVNRESMSSALLGTDTSINQATGTLTDVPVTAQLGRWSEIGVMNIQQTGFAVKNTGGTVTYVLGTDYTVNWRLGWIQPLVGGAITDGQALKVSGTTGALTGYKIAGSTQTQIRAKLRLDGINFADQLPVIVDVHEAVIASNTAFDFLQNDFAKVSLPGRLKTPVGMSEPFTVTRLDNAI